MSAVRKSLSALAFSITFSIAEPIDSSKAFQDGDSTFVREFLDQQKIHALYNNGDFDPVIQVLDAFIKRNKEYSHSDSVFIAKHLAVVYSANPETREKGRYFMYRLLELLPSAKLVDMYVSEEVDRIFEKVREEFRVRQRAFGVDTARLVLPGRPRKGDSVTVAKKNRKWVPWSLALGTAAVATGTWVWLQSRVEDDTQPMEPVDVTVVTPKN